MLNEPPANPFKEICSYPGRRTLEYEYLLRHYLGDKRMPMAVVENTDSNVAFAAIAALYDRCRWFEEQYALLDMRNAELQGMILSLQDANKRLLETMEMMGEVKRDESPKSEEVGELDKWQAPQEGKKRTIRDAARDFAENTKP